MVILMISIALYRPQIPPNTGNISRLCVGLRLPLLVVGRPAFSIEEKDVKRAGLDHWRHLDFTHYRRFADFWRAAEGRRIVAVTKMADKPLWDFGFENDDVLLFGNETAGLPPFLLSRLEYKVRIPMIGPVRSLNLSNAVAVTAYEAMRQISGSSLAEKPKKRTYYRRLD